MPTVPQRHRQTDGRTIYDSNIALALRARAVKGKLHTYIMGGGLVQWLTRWS